MSLLSPFEKEHGLSFEHQTSCFVPNSVKIKQTAFNLSSVASFSLPSATMNYRSRISPAEISFESYEKCAF